MKSRVIRGVSKNARFVLVDTTEVVQKALDIHKCSPTAIDAFGRLLTAGSIMGVSLKGDDLLTLMTNTDGPLSKMVVTANSDGNVKGYVSNPDVDLPLRPTGKPDVKNLVGKGALRVIKDMGLKEPYIGLSEIVSGEIAEDIAYYYVTSEQTPTVIALGVDLKDNKTVRSAGGYMIQILPDSDEHFIDLLEEKIKAIRNVTELFKGGMDLERILKLLYEDMTDEKHEKLVEDYEILEEKELHYACNCNKDKYYRGLISLGKDELNQVFDEMGGNIETECQFCKEKYQFTKEDFKDFLNSEVQ